MDGRKDSSSLFSPDESEDANGLELSLGLSCNGRKAKCKETEAPKAVTMESPFERSRIGNGAAGKPKQGRSNGLDAALKHFLEGRLEEHEECIKVLDRYSPKYGYRAEGNQNLLKGEEALSSVNTKGAGTPVPALQEKHSLLDLQEGKEILGASSGTDIPASKSAVAATFSWSHLQHQGVPVHVIDAWKNQVVGAEMIDNETSCLLPHSETPCSPVGPILHSCNEDSAKHDSEKTEQARHLLVHWQILDQQRKFQEARKKRKIAVEEQKQNNKNDDERADIHGNDPEQLQSEYKEAISKEKVIEIDKEESSETPNNCKENDEKSVLKAKLSPQFVAETTDLEKDKSETWKQRPREIHGDAKCKSDMFENCQENMKNASSLPLYRLADASFATSISPSRGETGKSSCQNSSTGSQSFEKREIHNGGGEISSAVPVSDSASGPASGSSQSPLSITSAVLYPPGSSLPAVPMPQPLPVPLENPSSMSFPVGFPFPYFLQFVPPSVDSNPAFHLNSLQFPVAQGYMQYPIPSLESATSWMTDMRPPVASAFFGPSSAVTLTKTATCVMGEDERVQGTNVSETQNPVTSTIASMQGGDLTRTAPLRRTVTDLIQFQQEADSQLFSLLPATAANQLNLLQNLPGSGELTLKEKSMASGFHPFTASTRPIINSSSSLNGGQEQAFSGQNMARNDSTVNKEPNHRDQEEPGWRVDNPFERGSTENLPNLQSSELLGLRQGIDTGLKFGGTGSCPDLPWVSTTGSGLTGKSISGVLYRSSGNQVRIVCACHGKHMLPGEFLRHANDLDGSNAE